MSRVSEQPAASYAQPAQLLSSGAGVATPPSVAGSGDRRRASSRKRACRRSPATPRPSSTHRRRKQHRVESSWRLPAHVGATKKPLSARCCLTSSSIDRSFAGDARKSCSARAKPLLACRWAYASRLAPMAGFVSSSGFQLMSPKIPSHRVPSLALPSLSSRRAFFAFLCPPHFPGFCLPLVCSLSD